jgi:hypothetical protein
MPYAICHMLLTPTPYLNPPFLCHILKYLRFRNGMKVAIKTTSSMLLTPIKPTFSIYIFKIPQVPQRHESSYAIHPRAQPQRWVCRCMHTASLYAIYVLNPLSIYVTHLLNPLSIYVTHLLNPLSLYVTHLLNHLSIYVTHLLNPLTLYDTHLLNPLSQPQRPAASILLSNPLSISHTHLLNPPSLYEKHLLNPNFLY